MVYLSDHQEMITSVVWASQDDHAQRRFAILVYRKRVHMLPVVMAPE